MNPAIDIVRHILAVAVILQHMHSLSRYSETTNAQLSQIVDFVDGAVWGFFFISGYLFRVHADLRCYIFHQVSRLLGPYFLFSFLYVFILSLLGKMEIYDGVVNVLLLNGGGMQLYFLPYLAVVTIGYSVVFSCKILRNFVFVDFLFSIFFVFLAFYFFTPYSSGADLRLFPFYLSAFCFGRVFSVGLSGYYRSAFLILVLVMLGFCDGRFFDAAGFIALFLCFDGIRKIFPRKRFKYSGGVYLLHTPILNFSISTLLLYFGVTELLNVFLSVVLTYFTSVFVSYYFVRIFPSKKWILLE